MHGTDRTCALFVGAIQGRFPLTYRCAPAYSADARGEGVVTIDLDVDPLEIELARKRTAGITRSPVS